MFWLLGKVGVFLQSDDVQIFIEDAGIYAPIIFSIVYIITLVLAPLTGFPLWITGIGVFGVMYTVLLTYGLSLVAAILNFYIARKFGRPVLKHLVSEKGVAKVDSLALHFGVEALILARLFQVFLFEWISYAAGLTKIEFRKYFIITVVASIPSNIILFFVALKINDLGQLFVILTGINYILLTIPFVYFFLKRYVVRKMESKVLLLIVSVLVLGLFGIF